MIKKKILIIGAGWYGCHLGLFLKKKNYSVIIYEKNTDIFQGSSGKNQFRLHQGYHYPRSSITIQEAKKNYQKFKKKYAKFIKFPNNNIYCIARNASLIDFGTFLNTLKANKLLFFQNKFNFLKNVEGAVLVKEGVFQNNKIIKYFKKKLKKEIVFKKEVQNIKKLSLNFDYVIDCTNNTQKNNFKDIVKYILTISFIYKKKFQEKENVYALTVMDGQLPSLYPYADKKNYFTLTHSKYTHIKRFSSYNKLQKYKSTISKQLINNHKKLSEQSICDFYTNFKSKFIYKGYFLSYKVIPSGKSDYRPTFYKKEKNILSIFSPKIANIFSAETLVSNFINGKKN
jgi:hypothetical protein